MIQNVLEVFRGLYKVHLYFQMRGLASRGAPTASNDFFLEKMSEGEASERRDWSFSAFQIFVLSGIQKAR